MRMGALLMILVTYVLVTGRLAHGTVYNASIHYTFGQLRGSSAIITVDSEACQVLSPAAGDTWDINKDFRIQVEWGSLRTGSDGSGNGTIYAARILNSSASSDLYEAVGYDVGPMTDGDFDSDGALRIVYPLPTGPMILLLRAGGLDRGEEEAPNFLYGMSGSFFFSNNSEPSAPVATADPTTLTSQETSPFGTTVSSVAAPISVPPSSTVPSGQDTPTDTNGRSSSSVTREPSPASPGTITVLPPASASASSPPNLPPSSPTSPAATVIGAAVGGVLGALVLGLTAALLLVLRRRRKETQHPGMAHDQHREEQEHDQGRIPGQIQLQTNDVTELHGDEKAQGPGLHELAGGHEAAYELPGGVGDGHVLKQGGGTGRLKTDRNGGSRVLWSM